MLMDIIMKKEKEYIRVYRMLGSKPGVIPFDRRDYGLKGVGPWGNPKDWMNIAEDIQVDGVAFIDEIDSPHEVIYVEK
jgi:hypothetical protein